MRLPIGLQRVTIDGTVWRYALRDRSDKHDHEFNCEPVWTDSYEIQECAACDSLLFRRRVEAGK